MPKNEHLMRRVAGWHDLRLDGFTDLLLRARGMSVMDVGCNRGLAGFELANNGATTVHGCDNYAEGIATARNLFIDLRNCRSQFEVVDLSIGKESLAPFGAEEYDLVMVLATTHKLRRVMEKNLFDELILELARRTLKFFAWRGKDEESIDEMDKLLDPMRRVHLSRLSDLGPAVIWGR